MLDAQTSFARPLAQRNAIWNEYAFLSAPSIDNSSEVIDLAQNYLSEPVPAHIVQAANDALARGQTHYVDRMGIKPLREAIAATLTQEGNGGISAENILVTSGAQEAFFVALRGLMKSGDEMLVPDPGYPLIHPIAELAGGVVVPLSSAADRFECRAVQYENALTARTRFLVLPSPNPATCRVIAPHELENILELAARHNLIVLLDAALGKGLYAGSAYKFTQGLPERLLWIGSVSKLYRMSGWRIGWIVGSDALLNPLRDLKQALSICSASVSQWAAAAALTGPQEWLAEQQAQFIERRGFVMDALNAMGLSTIRPDAAFYVFVNIARTGFSSEAFADFALNQANVRVTPGTMFGRAGEGFVRLSLASPLPLLSDAIARLRAALALAS